MKLTAATLAFLLPGLALAEASRPPPPDPAAMEKRHRVAQTLELAALLDLDTAHALQLEASLAELDARRKPLRERLDKLHQDLRRIADGGASTDGELDKLVQLGLELDGQMRQLDLELFRTVSRGLNAQQKARLAEHLLHGGAHHGPPPGSMPGGEGQPQPPQGP